MGKNIVTTPCKMDRQHTFIVKIPAILLYDDRKVLKSVNLSFKRFLSGQTIEEITVLDFLATTGKGILPTVDFPH